uniref:Probable glycine dehydrogenase (decarboxylating) subunit 2 n=1 Tax=candidate division WOR-3 bacterium TaxID=2052148 RepID=A0A7C4U7C3_UNCW3
MEILKELSKEGKKGYRLSVLDVPEKRLNQLIPEKFLRKEKPGIPEISEPEVVRHFVNLSILNHHVDKGFYPLGSCTMKYNPKINEEISRLSSFTNLHPLQDDETVQGALQLMYELQEMLGKVTGFNYVSLQPAAGAHGELTGLLIMSAYHKKKGRKKSKILIPDSAHGTNPASATRAGFVSVKIPSNEEGILTPQILKEHLDDDVAGLMITNPNTLGIFEEYIKDISDLLHSKDALLYMDGANMNALMGYFRPGDAGIDILHLNLHKTFSAPHGGGGPGAGGVCVQDKLEEFLPVPRIVKRERFYLDWEYPYSIGKVISFFGNFNVLIKSYVYLKIMGYDGLKEATEQSVINANYLLKKLKDYYDLPYKRRCMHEFVLSGERFKKFGVKTLDIAKRLLDFGFHAPTVYFPLIVSEALMIEPTETESKDTLDRFVEKMIQISKEAETNPELLKEAPKNTPVRRLNEAQAARDLNVRW